MHYGVRYEIPVFCLLRKSGIEKKTSFNNCVAHRTRPSLWLKTKRRNDI